jgi:hypothetical protein
LNWIINTDVVAKEPPRHDNDYVTIVWSQLQKLIEIFHVIMMEDSSDLVAGEQFVR